MLLVYRVVVHRSTGTVGVSASDQQVVLFSPQERHLSKVDASVEAFQSRVRTFVSGGGGCADE